jgi:hypothetical protein
MIMIKFSILFLFSLNPNLADSMPGEWVGGNGFSQSPAVLGNVCINPALADTQDYLFVNFRIFSDDYMKAGGGVSSAFFNMPAFLDVSVGGKFDILYDSRIRASTNILYGDYTYTNRFRRIGGIYNFGGFIKRAFGPVSFGADINLLNGKIEDLRRIDMTSSYYDVVDTVSTYFRGYSVGLGFYCNFGSLNLGGYYTPYQELEKWEVKGEEEEFELDLPLRFGLNYSFTENKMISFSIDRKEAVVGLNYGFLRLGYGKMYSMGNGVEVDANRFLGGVTFEMSGLPIHMIFENRRYSGDFADNEFIASLGVSISGKGGENEKEF